MAKKGNQHVVPRNGQWAVHREGAQRATSIHRTQREAIDAAREIACDGDRSRHHADRALREAFAKAVEEHRQAGVPLVLWRDGEIVEVPADELPADIDSDSPKTGLRT